MVSLDGKCVCLNIQQRRERQSVLVANCQGSLLANSVPQEMLEHKESGSREGRHRDMRVRIGLW